MQFHKISTEHRIFADDLNSSVLKTGDLILFKAYNNFNSIFTGSYFGHVGVVYILDDIPMLFEANGIEQTPLRAYHSKRGIFLTPLIDRIKKYKGRCFLKPLNKNISPKIIAGFTEFIQYSLTHFEYNYNLVTGCIKRMLGISKCGLGTDCGQITFLSLIKLGLLDQSEYDTPRLHHLLYTCNITNLQNGYKYLPLIEVIDHPFAY